MELEDYEQALRNIEHRVKQLDPPYTVAIGCTDGKFRSIVLAEEFAERERKSGKMVRLIHLNKLR